MHILKHYGTLSGMLLGGVLLSGCSGGSDEATSASNTDPAASASVLGAASARLGLDAIDTITYSGDAWRIRNSFRQTLSASPPWPEHDEISNYVRTIDLDAPASRATGETFASNLFLEPPVAGVYQQNVAADTNAWGQQLEIWLTPWGFLKGAGQYNASEGSASLDGQQYRTLTWQSPADQVSPSGLRYTVTGYIDNDNLVRRVETRVEDAFMGDMLVAGVYDDYEELNGVLAPTTMEQERGGGGIFGVNLESASINPANAAELLAIPTAPPRGGFGGPGGAPAQEAEQLAEGVHLVRASYNSMLVEFDDHLVVLEAGGSPQVGEQILEEAARLYPNKPVRYLVVSHPHSDHTAGMIPLVAAGATVVTHENNVEFLHMALSTPRTLLGEATLEPQFMSVDDGVTVLEDATGRVDLHYIANMHSDGTLVMVIPKANTMLQADFTLPVAGAEANPFVVNLAEYVDENNVQFEHYVPVHASPLVQTRADLMAAIGK